MLPHHKIKSAYVILLLSSVFLSGCWSAKEIDRLAYVAAVGLDVSEIDPHRIEVTFVIINPDYGPQKSSQGDEPPREIISIIADDFITAREMANTVIAKEVTYDALSDIIISEKFASDENFIRYMYDASKDSEIRRDTEMIISKEDAYTFLMDNKPLIEIESHRYFELIRERGQENGIIPADSQLLFYTRITEAAGDLFLATYATTQIEKEPEPDQYDGQFKAGDFHFKGEVNTTQFAGSAVFKNGKMIGTMTGEESSLAILLNNTLQSENLVTPIPDPFDSDYRISVRINAKRDPKVKMNLNHSSPTIDVELNLAIDVLTNHSMTDYFNHPEKKEVLKQSIKENLEEKMNRFIQRTQNEFKANPFGWSLLARKQFLTNKEYEQFNWMEQYPHIDIQLTVNVDLGRFGRQSEIPKLKQ